MNIDKEIEQYLRGEVRIIDIAIKYDLTRDMVMKLCRKYEKANFATGVDRVIDESYDPYFDHAIIEANQADRERNASCIHLTDAQLIKKVKARINEERQRRKAELSLRIPKAIDEWFVNKFIR